MKMKSRKSAVLAIALLLVSATICTAQQGTAPMKNGDVIQMVGSGLGDDAVIDLIQSSSTQFDLSSSGVAGLKKAKVSAKVIAAMKAAEAARLAAAKADAASVAASPAGSQTASAATQAAHAATALPPCQAVPVPAAANSQQAMAAVAIVAGGNAQPLPPAMTQVAQTGTGPAGSGPGLLSLDKLATSNLSFASLSSKALMFMPQVAVATKLIGAFHHAGKPPATTVAMALPGAHAAVAAPPSSFALDVQYGNVVNLNPDEYQPTLVQLTPSSNSFRLVGARQLVQQANGLAPQQGAITEKRVEVKASQLDRGHVTLEPAAPLPPGEYAVVLRAVNAQNATAASSSAAAQTASGATAAPVSNSQVEYMAWDFSVAVASAPQ
jgi:hypothetical protein